VTPPVAAGTPVVGPAAMVDATTVLVTSAVPSALSKARVSFVSIAADSPGLVKNADGKPRQLDIDRRLANLAVAGANGVGYVLAVDPAAPDQAVVHVFDPACAP